MFVNSRRQPRSASQLQMQRALPAAGGRGLFEECNRGPRGGVRWMEARPERTVRLRGRVIRRRAKIRRKKSAEARTGQILVQAPLLPLVCASEDDGRVFGRGRARPRWACCLLMSIRRRRPEQWGVCGREVGWAQDAIPRGTMTLLRSRRGRSMDGMEACQVDAEPWSRAAGGGSTHKQESRRAEWSTNSSEGRAAR